NCAPSKFDSATALPASRKPCAYGNLRASITMNARVWSATASAFFPGVVTTGTPCVDAASRSTVAGPPRAQHTSRRSGSASSTTSVTGAPCTTRISTPGIRSAISRGSPSYSWIGRSGGVADSSIWRYSSACASASGARPRRKMSADMKESPTTRIRTELRLRIRPEGLQVDGVAGPGLEDDLEKRFRIEVVEVDRLAQAAFHQDARPELLEMRPGHLRFLRCRPHHGNVVQPFAV